MAQNNLPLHPRERLPHTAPEILNSKPNADLQHGRFFISNEEFKMRVNVLCFQFCKIQSFAKFIVPNNYRKVNDRRLVCVICICLLIFYRCFLLENLLILSGCFVRDVGSTLLNF